MRNVASSTTGCTALRVRMTNSTAVTAVKAKSATHTAENHPDAGDCFKPISSAANESAINTTENASSLAKLESRVLPHGSNMAVATDITTPGATLIRNSHCHE